MIRPATLTLQHGPSGEVIAFAGAPVPHESMRRTTAPPGARRRDGARLARAIPRPSAPVPPGRSRPRRPQHVAAMALATPPGAAPARRLHDSLVHRLRQPLAVSASFSGGHVMASSSISFRTTKATARQTRGCRAAFHRRRARGLKLIGFSVWERRGGNGRNVTFPARQYAVNGERRSFALLRPIADTAAQERVRELVLQAYAEYEEQVRAKSRSEQTSPGAALCGIRTSGSWPKERRSCGFDAFAISLQVTPCMNPSDARTRRRTQPRQRPDRGGSGAIYRDEPCLAEEVPHQAISRRDRRAALRSRRRQTSRLSDRRLQGVAGTPS